MEKPKHSLTLFVSVALVGALASVGLFGLTIYQQPVGRFVGAYYYMFYTGWEGERACPPVQFYPSLGKYMSYNVSVQRQHLSWAKYAGIDFLALSWWGIDAGGANDPQFFDLAKEYGVKLCVMLEAYDHYYEPISHELQKHIDYVWEHYAGYPSYFWLYGKPLLLVYTRDLPILGLSDNRFVIRQIPLNFMYSPRSDAESTAQDILGDFISVMPGYNDTHYVERPFRWAQPRLNGQYYRQSWESAVVLGNTFRYKTLVCMITSFNEIPEQTFIEPSPAWGSLYLDLTREYSQKFKQTI